ncbi:single-strand binding protein/Primosomal replication protein n [Micromonospora aurantiaca ATCC 27029]|nr:single-strand binding protein/Primosomal replication protein n [Micromonospora aurantiaca ATCC 27029]
MFDTYVTIVGNVLTAPEWRRTTQSGTLVANFKVASTARRLDRDSGRWVDGNSLRVRVVKQCHTNSPPTEKRAPAGAGTPPGARIRKRP